MGRFTYLKNGRPCVLVNGAEITGPVAERLHAYEETGYEPGEVHDLADRIGKFHLDRGRQNLEAVHDAFQKAAETSELVAASIEGWVLIIPRGCKLGCRVFRPVNGELLRSKPGDNPDGDIITQIKFNRGGVHFKCCWGYFHLSDIGKTVFLTREAAEAELEKQKGGRGYGEG